MKNTEIRKMKVEEIQVKLTDAREELMKLRFQQVTGQLTDTSRMRLLRRDIARMETIARELLINPLPVSPAEQTEKKPKTRVSKASKAEVKEEKKESGKAQPKEKSKAKPKAKPKAEEGEA